MNYCSLKDMVDDVSGWLPELASNYDCVVGIPRSGMLPASMIATKLNLPLSDSNGLLEGRLFLGGERTAGNIDGAFFEKSKRILVVDDSVRQGRAMSLVRDKLSALDSRHRVTYAAVYVSPSAQGLVDTFARVVDIPRVFEWNVLSNPAISNFCFDLDGVLCVDPTESQNDDGALYQRFIEEAQPLFISKHKIGWIVTSRLEKYRDLTERWLDKHGVQYGQLIMLNLESKAERLRLGAAVPFKAKMYRETGAALFVESSTSQARGITQLSGGPVYDLESRLIVRPDGLTGNITSSWRSLRHLHKRVVNLLRRLRNSMNRIR